jgi:hypothetical protein
MGNKNDPNAPRHLVIAERNIGKRSADYYLQPVNKNFKPLNGEIASRESVHVTHEIGVKVQSETTSNDSFVLGRGGQIRDHLSGRGVSGNANGFVFKKQTYQVWFRARGQEKGFRYDIDTVFQQFHRFENGRSVENHLGILSP